jgi:hypothetical protein
VCCIVTWCVVNGYLHMRGDFPHDVLFCLPSYGAVSEGGEVIL